MSNGSGGIAGIVKILVVLVIVYFAVTEGWPWLRDELRLGGGDAETSGGEPGGSGDGGHCVALASRASEALGGEIRRFRQPPYDLDAWGAAVAAVEERTYEADVACSCPLESCQTAAAALVELRDLTGAVDSVIRGDPTAFRNPARQQERIDELLAQARGLAHEGR